MDDAMIEADIKVDKVKTDKKFLRLEWPTAFI